MYWQILLFIAFLIPLFLFFWQRWQQQKLAALPVHFPSLPLIGAFYGLSTEPIKQREQFWDLCYHQNIHAGICGLQMGPWPFALIYKPEYFQDLLNSHEIRKALDYKFAKPWLGEGLITSRGEKWYNHRKLISQSFHFNILNEFLPIMNEHSEVFLRSLEKFADNGEAFDLFPMATLLTLDIICETAMGQSLDAQKGASQDYVDAVKDINGIIDTRFKTLHLWPDIFFKLTSAGKRHEECLRLLHGYSKKVIEDRVANFDPAAVGTKLRDSDTLETNGLEEATNESDFSLPTKGKKRLALLDTLLYASENFTKLSQKEIQEEVDTFLFAGHDTTAICFSWTLYLLSKNSEAQRKVVEEVDGVFGSSSRSATPNDLRQMKYLESCIKESLRMLPSVPVIARQLENDLKVGPYVLPGGTGVIALIEIMNHHPEYFVDPFNFRPERFMSPMPEALVPPKTHPYSFVPFAAGQRNCIGQRFAMLELKVILSSFFRRYSVEYSKSHQHPKPIMELLFRPNTGIFLQIKHC